MNKIIKNSKASTLIKGAIAGLAILFLGTLSAGPAAAGMTAVYGPYQTDTQCWIDVEAAHENGQTVTQGCQWRSINGQWGYYFVAY